MRSHITVPDQHARCNAWAQGWYTTGAPSVTHPSRLPSQMFKNVWLPPLLLFILEFPNIQNMCRMCSMVHHAHICRVPRIYGKCRHKHIGSSQTCMSGVPQNPALVHHIRFQLQCVYTGVCTSPALPTADSRHVIAIVVRYIMARSWGQVLLVRSRGYLFW